MSVATNASAGVNTFSALGPEGGSINEIVFHPQDASIVYAATTSGFYRSIDGGEAWQLVADSWLNGSNAVAVHPSNPELLFVVVQGMGLYSSSDGGETLSELSTFPARYELAGQIEIASDGTVYVATSDRVYRTTDLGLTWHEGDAVPPTDSAIRVLRINPDDPNTLYAISTDRSLFQSVDRGDNWVSVSLPDEEPSPGVSYVEDVAIAGTNPERVWIATNSGLWTKLADDITWSHSSELSMPTRRIEIDPLDPSVLYAAAYTEGLYRSVDGGQHWTNIQNGAPTGIIDTIAIAENDPQRLLIGGFEGIASSADAGATWAARNAGIMGARADKLVPAPGSDRIYVATSFNGVHFIDGATLSVTSVDNDGLRALSGTMFLPDSVHVASEAPDELWVPVRSGLARSFDGGVHWQLHSTSDFANGAVWSFATAIVDEQRVFLAITSTAIYRSTNSGTNWFPVDGLDSYESVGPTVAVSASNPAVLFLSARVDDSTGVLLRSADGGASWEPTALATDGYVWSLAVDPTDERVLYAGANHALLKSVDGGDSWSALEWVPNPELAFAIAIDPLNPNILFAAVSTYIRRSVDGGQTWESLPGPQPTVPWDVRSLALDAARPYRLFAAAGNRGVREISLQPDLVIEASGPASVFSEAQAAYALGVMNSGPFDATNVVATIALDGLDADVSASSPGAECAVTGMEVRCAQSILRVGESIEIAVSATYSSVGTATVTANVTGDQPDAVSTNNSATLSTTVTAPPPPPPAAPPPPPAAAPPQRPQTGGGGGGGASSALLLGLLALLAAFRRTSV